MGTGLRPTATLPILMPADQTITAAVASAAQRLVRAGCDTPQLDAEVLLAYTLQEERSRLYLKPEARLDQAQLVTFSRLIARREKREPVAYIVGHKAFFALDFLVNRHVLVPRPETELLVETALELMNDQTGPRAAEADGDMRRVIADVGTGSGCIAIALARHITSATVFASDISVQALKLARRNAGRLGVSSNIRFMVGDLLTPYGVALDLIVSNPPYVSQVELESPGTAPEIGLYEPSLALDGGLNGLDIIRRVLSQAKKRLKSNGSLLVEIGSDQGQSIIELGRIHFPQASIEIKQDLAGLDRLLVVKN